MLVRYAPGGTPSIVKAIGFTGTDGLHAVAIDGAGATVAGGSLVFSGVTIDSTTVPDASGLWLQLPPPPF
jgi:hypothetical protein